MAETICWTSTVTLPHLSCFSDCRELWKTISVFGKKRGRDGGGWWSGRQMRAQSYLEVTVRVKWNTILLLLLCSAWEALTNLPQETSGLMNMSQVIFWVNWGFQLLHSLALCLMMNKTAKYKIVQNHKLTDCVWETFCCFTCNHFSVLFILLRFGLLIGHNKDREAVTLGSGRHFSLFSEMLQTKQAVD